MVSLRFPFLSSLPQPPPQPPRPFSTLAAAAAAAAGATAAFVSISSSDRDRNAMSSLFSSHHSLPLWGSLSLADNAAPVVESRTGSSFPSALDSSQKLCGIGLRRKCIFGLKNIDVYAFGMTLDFFLSTTQMVLKC